MTENLNQDEHQQFYRPNGLTYLSILSFIGSGLSLFANAMVFLFYNTFAAYLTGDEISEVPMAFDPELLYNYVMTAGRMFFLFNSLLYFVSLIGVYYMWHLIKKGIHFYAIAQILVLLLPLIFIDSGLSVLPGLILSGSFIYFYSRYLKIMS